MRGIPGGDGGPRAVGADTTLHGGRVGMAHVEAIGGKAEGAAEDLGERRLEPRPHGRGAGVHGEAAVGASLDAGRLEGTQPRLLHVHGEPDAAPDAPGAEGALFRARGIVAEALEEAGEERREIPGVVNGGHAKGDGAAVVRHVGGGEEIPAADRRGIEAEARGGHVHEALAGEVALRPSRRAERAHGGLVGDHVPEIARVVRHTIGPGEERGAKLGGQERRRAHVGADVGVDDHAHGADPPVRLEADLEIVGDLAGVVGRGQVLAPALHPPHGTIDLEGGQRNQDVLGVELAADAEAPSDVDLGEPERARRHA